MGFSRQEYWSGLPFPSLVDHVLSELSTVTCPSWVAWLIVSLSKAKLWSMWSVWSVFCDCSFHSVCLWCIRIRDLLKLSDGRDWLRGKLGLVMMGRATLSKSLIGFSVGGWGCVPFQLFDLKPNYGGDNERNGDLLQKFLCMHCPTQCRWPCSRSLPETPRHSGARLGQSLVGSLLLSPESCVAAWWNRDQNLPHDLGVWQTVPSWLS